MKKKIVLMLAVLFAAWSGIQAKTALLIVAHGSPMESWRKPVLDLEPMVKQQLANGKLKGIDLVKVALMEYTEPSVASMVKACEAEGADSIFALPIFIAPSGHTEEDLPNILGQKYNPYVREELAERKPKWCIHACPSCWGRRSITAMYWRKACSIAFKAYRNRRPKRL